MESCVRGECKVGDLRAAIRTGGEAGFFRREEDVVGVGVGDVSVVQEVGQ